MKIPIPLYAVVCDFNASKQTKKYPHDEALTQSPIVGDANQRFFEIPDNRLRGNCDCPNHWNLGASSLFHTLLFLPARGPPTARKVLCVWQFRARELLGSGDGWVERSG